MEHLEIYEIYAVLFFILLGILLLESLIVRHFKTVTRIQIIVSSLAIASIEIAIFSHIAEADYGPGAELVLFAVLLIYLAIIKVAGCVTLPIVISLLNTYSKFKWICIALVLLSLLSMPSFRAVVVMSKAINFHVQFVSTNPNYKFQTMKMESRIYQGDYSYTDIDYKLNEDGYYNLKGSRGTRFSIRRDYRCRALVEVRSATYRKKFQKKSSYYLP